MHIAPGHQKWDGKLLLFQPMEDETYPPCHVGGSVAPVWREGNSHRYSSQGVQYIWVQHQRHCPETWELRLFVNNQNV